MISNSAPYGQNSYLESIGYRPVRESVYTISHPLVIEWTRKFHNEFLDRRIFNRFETAVQQSDSISRALVIGYCWHQFSSLVPWILCHASTIVSTNHLRHYLIQTAFEELGMRNSDEIHADMFSRVVTETQGTLATKYARSQTRTLRSLELLKQTGLSLKGDGITLGFLLGLEIPAEENIETVFRHLSVREDIRTYLERSQFFLLHRQIESEHIRLNVSTFLRFCSATEDRNQFAQGVSLALDFWASFWAEVARKINVASSRDGI